MEDKVSSTHGRCSASRCRTSWSSHRWSSPTAGCTRPCWRRSPPGRSYSDLREGGREEMALGGRRCQASFKVTSGPQWQIHAGQTHHREQNHRWEETVPTEAAWPGEDVSSLHCWFHTLSLQMFLLILQVSDGLDSIGAAVMALSTTLLQV